MNDGSSGSRSAATVAWQVLGAEGLAAFRDRWLDRVAAWRRRRGYRLVDATELNATVPVLSVLATPPRPDFGGVQVQLLRRLRAERRPHALLYADAGGYRLEVAAEAGRQAVRFPAEPPDPMASRDAGFENAVSAATASLGAAAVHVEQPLGLPLESLLRLRRSGLRLVLSLHDFALFCLRPHLVEHPRLAFCHYCRDDARCAACLRQDWPVDAGFQAARRAVAAELFAAADAVVYPSDFLRRRYRELLAPRDAGEWVVPPLSPLPAPLARPPHRPSHVAYVGSVRPHKGALVFEELTARFPGLRWSAFGGGDPEILRRWRRASRISVRGYYRAGSLPRLLRRHRVDLALLLSIVPESYGLTLDECRAAGTPVIAFDHGAVGDRIRRLGGGLLAPLEDGAAGVERRLRDALERPETLSVPVHADVESRSSLTDVYRGLGLV